MSGLGRRVPTDWQHIEKYPLTATTAPTAPVPVVIGIGWYTAFDNPERHSGAWWIGRSGSLGTIRGGHCVCLKPKGISDAASWYAFFNQQAEGSCVGWGCSRMMSLLNRKLYLARWLWDRAKDTDEYPDTNAGDDNGTTVRAALAILKAQGHVPWQKTYAKQESDYRWRDMLPGQPAEGIAAYRWATTVDQALQALGTPNIDYVTVLNSWGRDGYPHQVRMPATVLDRLLREEGEIGLVTDR
jgi:hypothetical protein